VYKRCAPLFPRCIPAGNTVVFSCCPKPAHRESGRGFHRHRPTGLPAAKDVRIEDRQWRDSDGDRQRKTCILVETPEGKQVKLGSMLTPERRKFLAGAVRKVLWG
jgi:hypothetical protein